MKGKKTSTKKIVKIKNALDKNALINTINNLSNEEVAKVIYDLHDFIYLWMGIKTRYLIKIIKKMSTYSFFDRVIDFTIIYSRLKQLDEFNDKEVRVFNRFIDDEIIHSRLKQSDEYNDKEVRDQFSKFMPELDEIEKHLFEKFNSLPNGIEKAELWLQPIATDAGSDSDVEAAIYFASRNKKEIINANNLKESWYESICNDVERGGILPRTKISKEIKKRAKSKTISLSEASEVLKDNRPNSLLRFFYFRDEEEDFIDSAFFRAVEWFSITGFEPWLDSLAHEISSGLTDGVDLI